MLETVRKSWIVLLLLAMLGIHASIVGIIRYQAAQTKLSASCEVDLGLFLSYPTVEQTPIEMRLHAIVPSQHRIKSRQLIELNQYQIRQALEENLRQTDPRSYADPYLTDLKGQLFDVLVQTIGSSSIEEIVITEVKESQSHSNLRFVRTPAPANRRTRITSLLHDSEDSQQPPHGDDKHPDETTTEHSQSGH